MYAWKKLCSVVITTQITFTTYTKKLGVNVVLVGCRKEYIYSDGDRISPPGEPVKRWEDWDFRLSLKLV